MNEYFEIEPGDVFVESPYPMRFHCLRVEDDSKGRWIYATNLDSGKECRFYSIHGSNPYAPRLYRET